ncbi:MAG: hypothetical protein ACP5FX_01950 [Candidatus Micrarchaeia archaeon]
MEIILILLSFVFGFVISFIDFNEDEKKKTPPSIFPIASSFIFLLLLFSKVFPLAFGVFLSLLFAKKLDAKSWKIFLFFTILFLPLFLFKISQFFSLQNLLLSIYFFIFSFMDEISSDFTDKELEKEKKRKKKEKEKSKKEKIRKFVLEFFELRPFLELSAFLYSLAILDFDFFLCIFSFDLAYNLEKRLLLV